MKKKGNRKGWKTAFKNIDERFWTKVVKRPDSCWIWTRGRNQYGYGLFSVNKRLVLAVRWIYERTKGPILAGLELDHLCRNPACVNPDHVQPVTRRENQLRGFGPAGLNASKTHCVNGHEFTPENTHYFGPDKRHRRCRKCNAISERERQRRKRHGIKSGKK